jgi:hypothetical protein
MMKFMLFGLLIRGELVTCQYMLSETRSIITVVFIAFRECSLTRKRSRSAPTSRGSGFDPSNGLLTLVADAVQALVFHMGPSPSAIVGHKGFTSLQLPQPINLQGTSCPSLLLYFQVRLTCKANPPLFLLHTRSVMMYFLSLAPSFYDETHTTFAVFARIPT